MMMIHYTQFWDGKMNKSSIHMVLFVFLVNLMSAQDLEYSIEYERNFVGGNVIEAGNYLELLTQDNIYSIKLPDDMDVKYIDANKIHDIEVILRLPNKIDVSHDSIYQKIDQAVAKRSLLLYYEYDNQKGSCRIKLSAERRSAYGKYIGSVLLFTGKLRVQNLTFTKLDIKQFLYKNPRIDTVAASTLDDTTLIRLEREIFYFSVNAMYKTKELENASFRVIGQDRANPEALSNWVGPRIPSNTNSIVITEAKLDGYYGYRPWFPIKSPRYLLTGTHEFRYEIVDQFQQWTVNFKKDWPYRWPWRSASLIPATLYGAALLHRGRSEDYKGKQGLACVVGGTLLGWSLFRIAAEPLFGKYVHQRKRDDLYISDSYDNLLSWTISVFYLLDFMDRRHQPDLFGKVKPFPDLPDPPALPAKNERRFSLSLNWQF